MSVEPQHLTEAAQGAHPGAGIDLAALLQRGTHHSSAAARGALSHRRAAGAAADAPPRREPCVFVVASDDARREELCKIIGRDGLHVEPFTNSESFLERRSFEQFGCVVHDREARGTNSAVLLQDLAAQGVTLPVIVTIGEPDVRSVVAEMRSGAFDVHETPFDAPRLTESIRDAVACHWQAFQDHARREQVRQRYGRLTRREREVAELVVAGSSSRDIAALLGVGEKTIEVYRSRIKGKMQARNSADLTRMLQSLHA